MTAALSNNLNELDVLLQVGANTWITGMFIPGTINKRYGTGTGTVGNRYWIKKKYIFISKLEQRPNNVF